MIDRKRVRELAARPSEPARQPEPSGDLTDDLDPSLARARLIAFLEEVEPTVDLIERVTAILDSNGRSMGLEQMRQLAEIPSVWEYMEMQRDPIAWQAFKVAAGYGYEQALNHQRIETMRRQQRRHKGKDITEEQRQLSARLNRVLVVLTKFVMTFSPPDQEGDCFSRD